VTEQKQARGIGSILWWVLMGLLFVGLIATYVVAHFKDALGLLEFHRFLVAIVCGIFVIAVNVLGLAFTLNDFDYRKFLGEGAYWIFVGKKLKRVLVYSVPLLLLLYGHLIIFCLAGILHPLSLFYLAVILPGAFVHGGIQGMLARLLSPNGAIAGVVLVVFLLVQAALPLICCLPTFNLPLTAYFMVEPANLADSPVGMAGPTSNYLTAMALALGFSTATHAVFTAACYFVGLWRFRTFTSAKNQIDSRKHLVQCRHCGDRIEPGSNPCPMCGEDDPFAD
jgi:hypothetical protein